jgi:hypothetical protein
MKVHRVFRYAPLAILMGAILTVPGTFRSAIAIPPAPNSLAEAKLNPVDMFAAQKAGDLEVGLIPRDEKRVTLILTNKGDKPLTIRIPDAFAGAPVLAQIGQPVGFPNNNNNNNGRAPQSVGIGGPGAQPFGMNNGFQQNGFNAPGFMSIPPGKTVKVRLPAVCLEYGKPTPYPHSPYTVVPLDTVTSAEGVKEVVASLGAGQSDQRLAQLAVWHLANGKSWDSLAALKVAKIGRRDIPEYSPEELAAAQVLAEKAKGKKKPAATTASK